MHTRGLRIFLSYSFAGHIAICGILALLHFSLARPPSQMSFKPAVYFGIMPVEFLPAALTRRPVPICASADALPAPGPVLTKPVTFDNVIKPSSDVSCVASRVPAKSPPIVADAPKYKDSAFTLHPLLPYQFDLYFKDRQTVHIELEFAITQADNRNFVSLRRKISSGNLEADLLSMRYIGHYLFIQQARFMPEIWQTVNIEFSPNTR